jgi:quercetin dioxygenase-like cupin family protein
MQTLMFDKRRGVLLAFSVLALGFALPHASAVAQGAFVVTPLVEKKVTELPTGALYWQVENFASLEAAEAAAGPMSLAAEAEDKAWLFTLGAKGAASNGGTMVTEIGPVPRIEADEYLLRINSGFGRPGAKTAVHTHPGAESFLVLSGQLTQTTPKDVHVLDAGQTMPGVPYMPMEVSSTGSTDLHELIMFVVDASQPFSSPATLD